MILKPANSKLKVLVADDSPSIRMLVSRTMSKMGFDVTECSTGTEAAEYIKKDSSFSVYVLDWIMGGCSGIDLCKAIRKQDTESYKYILILTGNDSINDMVEGLESGADDYLVKPISVPELRARIQIGVRLFDYEQEFKRKEQNVRISCYKALTELAEKRDTETGSHLSRVAALASKLAKEIGCSENFCEEIELFAPMHDIGKVGIPDGILHLPRKLTDVEFNIIKTHAEIGYKILKNAETLETAATIAYTHHERWDGSGYPRGLKGENIPLAGRIVALVDSYDALRSRRVYKQEFSHSETCEFIRQAAGKQYDPDLVEAFFRIDKELMQIFDSQYDSQKAEEIIQNLESIPSK